METQDTSRLAVLVGPEIEENLALRYLASAIRAAGQRAKIVAFNRIAAMREAAEEALREPPRLVGISVSHQHRAAEFFALARLLRSMGYKGHITAGGHYPTAAWEEMLALCEAFDTVVRHEGEDAIVELLEVADAPERWPAVKGLCFRDAAGAPVFTGHRPPVEPLDRLAFPARDTPLRLHAGFPFVPIAGSRGCYGSCVFCSINGFSRSRPGRRLRYRTPANVAEEMSVLYHEKGARLFCFHDDIFLLPRPADSARRCAALGAELRRRGVGKIGVIAKCRPENVETALLRELRAEIGLMRLFIGVENGSETGLRNLGRGTDVRTAHAALDAAREAGIFACYNILLFEPDTILAEIEENIEFASRHPYFPFNFCRTEVYAGSELERRLAAAGRLSGPRYSRTYEMSDPRVELLFTICHVAFFDRNFAPDGLANSVMGFGYEAQIPRHFFGTAEAEALYGRAERLVGRVNSDTLARLREALRFAGENPGADAAAANAFALKLATEVNLSGAALQTELERIRAEIENYSIGMRKGPKGSGPGTPGQSGKEETWHSSTFRTDSS